ncbi:alpha/beta fold hydrolase [Mycolicibacterium parafortuitum]|uniref:Alpha/beta hydrolase [Nocardia brasiliensis ATCC] n=1 Tax=Mycolicibacterium parafortuitum TaxID=39692 RepID=A0A375YHB6_MYCPF|nr:alpha/beta hydrolase [Mycolicibacterium parafortuitum]ORB27805.1 alpha/beta hydrolase [Mycolicibacterium parafortuitum]SRX80535.1 alpha/beta hydrolase [Nocardia brasiliensis ATCC] [Mycolicibacterium parafortuitum]
MLTRRAFAAGIGLAVAATSPSVPGAGPPRAPAAPSSFASLKNVEAGDLSIGYAEDGAADGPAVILLHGWPYDIHSYADVAPLLVARGYRILVPYLRGYGSTVFRSVDTMRTGQQAALAQDVVDFMDALGIDRAVIGGVDWGARSADIVAALWPERCKALVSVSGYLIVNLSANQRPLPPAAEHGWWYQYYFATERGAHGYTAHTRDFNKLIWREASPSWNFSDATYDRTADAFANPDHVAVVIHNYRWRLSLAPGAPRYDDLERRLAASPPITVPAITIGSDFDGPNKNGAAYRSMFTGPYAHRVLDGIGHDVPQEAPREFADAVIAADRL